MVGMCMCDKYVVNVCQIYIGSLQLRENSVASATINQQQCLVYMECETSVVTMRGMSIARTKKADMVVVECFFVHWDKVCFCSLLNRSPTKPFPSV